MEEYGLPLTAIEALLHGLRPDDFRYVYSGITMYSVLEVDIILLKFLFWMSVHIVT